MIPVTGEIVHGSGNSARASNTDVIKRVCRPYTPAIAYLRTSSAANVGADKGSDKRQRDAIAAYAKHAGFAVVDTYYDAAVSGADPIETRPGFLALLDRIEGDGVRTVLIEDASRFARELITQELGILSLIKRGVRVLTAAGDDLTATDDPFKKAMRQMRVPSLSSKRRGWWPSCAMRASAFAASGASARVARRASSGPSGRTTLSS